MKKEETERYNKAKELRKLYDWRVDKEICENLDKILRDYEKRDIQERKNIPLTDVEKLAILLHELQCRYHGDCTWDYEIQRDELPPGTYLLPQNQWPKDEERHPVHLWDNFEHADYLERAKKLMKKLEKYNYTFEQLSEIVRAANNK